MAESVNQTKFGPIWAKNKVSSPRLPENHSGGQEYPILSPIKAHFVPNHKSKYLSLITCQKGSIKPNLVQLGPLIRFRPLWSPGIHSGGQNGV